MFNRGYALQYTSYVTVMMEGQKSLGFVGPLFIIIHF